MNNIYKEIYNLPEIQKRLRPLTPAWICTVIGLASGFILVTNPSLSEGLNALLSALAAIGIGALITILCYYTFGDSRAPYHKPSHKLLTSEQIFYSATSKEAVVKAVAEHDMDGLSKIKKSNVPQIVLVRYSDEEETVAFSQVVDNQGEKMEPLTDIIADNLR